jgi:hypothetical protein
MYQCAPYERAELANHGLTHTRAHPCDCGLQNLAVEAEQDLQHLEICRVRILGADQATAQFLDLRLREG